MKTRKWMTGAVLTLGALTTMLPFGCADRTEKKEVEVHGPNKSYEVEVESKEHHHDRD